MQPNRERYRRLPGRRRGFLFGSSVWLGSDHLLLVKSSRFREEYKRFYFRDVQAIVTAKTPRFHISTSAAAIAWLWFAAFLALGELGYHGNKLDWVPVAMAAPLVIGWLYISIARSCRARIYTAVSSDELPSLYRTWTARRFLRKVEPYLTQAQGALEADWADAVEDKQVGPLPEGRVGLATPGPAAPLPPPTPLPKTARTPVSFLFVGSMCLGGLADLLTLPASPNVGRWILLSFLLLQVVATVAVLVQSYMGKLVPSLRNLAIVALVSIGVWYYAALAGASFVTAFENARSQHPTLVPTAQQNFAGYPISRETAGGMGLLLGLVGAILVMRGERAAEEKVSFNV